MIDQPGIGPCVRITPEAGTVKSGKARAVPLHEHLLAQGFLDAVKAVCSGPLFYRPHPQGEKAGRRPRAVKARENLASWVRSVGVTDKGLSPNHAWRHTFKRIAYRAGIERQVRDAIVGHSPRDVTDQYETPSVEDMAEALRRFPRYTVETARSDGATPHDATTQGRSTAQTR